jgi:outer membrane protein assembly factor BamB
VFFGDDSGDFAAVDATNGKPLWSFMTNQNWKASPMTYSFDRSNSWRSLGSAMLRSDYRTERLVIFVLRRRDAKTRVL